MNTWIDNISRRLALRRARRAGPPANGDDWTGPDPAAYPMTRRQLARYAFKAFATTSVLGTVSLGRQSGTAFALDFQTCIAQMQALGATIGSNADNVIPSSTACADIAAYEVNTGVMCSDGNRDPGSSGCVVFVPSGSTPLALGNAYRGAPRLWCRDYSMTWTAPRRVDMLSWTPSANEACVQAEVNRWQDDLCSHELLHVQDIDRIIRDANAAWHKQTICIEQRKKPTAQEFDQIAVNNANQYNGAMLSDFNQRDPNGGNNVPLPNCNCTCTCRPPSDTRVGAGCCPSGMDCRNQLFNGVNPVCCGANGVCACPTGYTAIQGLCWPS